MNNNCCISGCELATLASTIACILSKNLNADDANIVGNFFASIGANLLTIASVKAVCENDT